MIGHWILIIISLKITFCEWILVPWISSNQNEISKESSVTRKFQLNFRTLKNVSLYKTENTCPDFHNLTMLSYGLEQETPTPSEGWKIYTEDIRDIIEQNKKIPKTSVERFGFLKKIEQKLINETENKIKSLFSTGFREARTKYIHSPSMESALLTISMLLFGVYLTKLMLKLLQSHYSKYNSNIGMMNGIRTPIFIAQTRRTRSIPTNLFLKELHLMHLINKYESQFN